MTLYNNRQLAALVKERHGHDLNPNYIWRSVRLLGFSPTKAVGQYRPTEEEALAFADAYHAHVTSDRYKKPTPASQIPLGNTKKKTAVPSDTQRQISAMLRAHNIGVKGKKS